MLFSRAVSVAFAILIMIAGVLGLLAHHSLQFSVPFILFYIHPSITIDALASFFILLTGISYFGISLFSIDYFKHFTLSQQIVIQIWQTLFVVAMLLVFIANDPFTFLFAWELMAFSSYFLVISIEPGKDTRKAGFLYLGMAHIGFFAIAASFFLLFSHLPISLWHFNILTTHLQLTQSLANIIFLLALVGFGAKAGLFPLHIWLPEAHPAAPSPISALMSGVMLKTAIYALLRFTFCFLLAFQQTWWGYCVVGMGLMTMFMGAIHAAMQTDMKRLLAYSSMENIGFIFTALGLAIIFYQYHQFILASMALLVVIVHCLNHSLFKSLLFLGTGSILHATGQRNLGKLGGLIHKMPWVSICTLIGTFAMAGVPFFNGFISEWLYLTIFFHQFAHLQFVLSIVSPLIIAISVLVFGLAGFVIIKFYGIAFLGQAREPMLVHAKPSTLYERIGLTWLAFLCVLLGLCPMSIIHYVQPIIQALSKRLTTVMQPTLLSLQFMPTNVVSGFDPICIFFMLLLIIVILFFMVKKFSPYLICRVPTWNCGYSDMDPRMQDTAEGFGQPFKQLFSPLISVKVKQPVADDPRPHYHASLSEKVWSWLYYPLLNCVVWFASFTKWIQQGRIATYLLYIGITLLILLTWVVWS